MSYVLCLCAAYSGIHNSVLVYVCCSLFEFVQNKTKKIIEYGVANKLRPFELSYKSLDSWVSLKGGASTKYFTCLLLKSFEWMFCLFCRFNTNGGVRFNGSRWNWSINYGDWECKVPITCKFLHENLYMVGELFWKIGYPLHVYELRIFLTHDNIWDVWYFGIRINI